MSDDSPRPAAARPLSKAEVLYNSCAERLVEMAGNTYPRLFGRRKKRDTDDDYMFPRNNNGKNEREYVFANEDLCSEVLMKVWRVALNPNAPDHDLDEFAAYAYKSVLNMLAKRESEAAKRRKRERKLNALLKEEFEYRVARRGRSVDPIADTAGDSYEARLPQPLREAIENEELGYMLRRARGIMGDRAFEVLRLKTGHRTFEEIANLLGISVKTVRSRWNDARKAWRRLKDAGSICWGWKHGLIDQNRG